MLFIGVCEVWRCWMRGALCFWRRSATLVCWLSCCTNELNCRKPAETREAECRTASLAHQARCWVKRHRLALCLLLTLAICLPCQVRNWVERQQTCTDMYGEHTFELNSATSLAPRSVHFNDFPQDCEVLHVVGVDEGVLLQSARFSSIQ